MKPLSVEMACLLGIQNEIQAVWGVILSAVEKKKVDKCWITWWMLLI